ncbi:MAG: SDR family oxidoreductase [Bacillota bacterium]|nr:SDR family oxidoreductase [Bacillota bacterium]
MILKDKVALITGGGTGIGAAVARRFVAEGARVCIVGRREERLDEVIKELPAGSVVKSPGDVSNPEDIQRIVQDTVDFGKGIDILVDNAGLGTEGSIVSADLDEWRKTFEVNLVGPFMLMRAVIPHMIKDGGAIINISSLAGLRCIPEGSAYCTSKAALNMMTRQAALDFGDRGIRCNAVCPGFVDTDMTRGNFGKLAESLGTDLQTFMQKVFKDVPVRKPGTPDRLAGICAFLASDDASYITGAIIPVDGGLAALDPFPLAVKRAVLEMEG